MTQKEILEAANAAQPEMMKKVAAMMYLTEQLDEGFAALSQAEMAIIVDSSVDGMEKLSFSPMAQVGIAAGGAIAGALGTAVASDLYDSAKRGLTASRNFKNILRHNPELLESHDKAKLRSAFNSLHRYGPEFTADPIVGGSYLGAVAADPHHSMSMLKDFTSARKSLLETKRKQFEPKFHDLGHTYLDATHRIEDSKERGLETDRREKFQREMSDIEHGRRLRSEVRRNTVEENKGKAMAEAQAKAQADRLAAEAEKAQKGREHQLEMARIRSNDNHLKARLEEFKMDLRDWVHNGRTGPKPTWNP